MWLFGVHPLTHIRAHMNTHMRACALRRVYPMDEGESIPFVGSLLAYEGWKAGKVNKAVLMGESPDIASGNASSCK